MVNCYTMCFGRNRAPSQNEILFDKYGLSERATRETIAVDKNLFNVEEQPLKK